MMDLAGAAPALYFHYYDGLGSVAALSNISGTIAEQKREGAIGGLSPQHSDQEITCTPSGPGGDGKDISICGSSITC